MTDEKQPTHFARHRRECLRCVLDQLPREMGAKIFRGAAARAEKRGDAKTAAKLLAAVNRDLRIEPDDGGGQPCPRCGHWLNPPDLHCGNCEDD